MADKTTKLTFATKTTGIKEIEKLNKTIGELGKIDAFRKLNADLKENKEAWKSAEVEVRRMAGEMRKVKKPTVTMRKEFDKAKKAAARLKGEYVHTQKRIKGLRESMRKSGIDTKNLVTEQKKLKDALAKARQEAGKAMKIDMSRGLLAVRPHKDIRREIKKTRLAYDRLKKSGLLSTRELTQAKRNLRKQTRELRGELGGLGGAFGKVRAGMAGLAAAAAGIALKKSVETFTDFSGAMAAVNTLLDVTPERFAELSDAVLKMTSRVPQGSEQLAAGLYDIISHGVGVDDAINVLELAAKAAVAGITDTRTAVNVGLGVVDAYGLSIDDLGQVYDVLFSTVKGGVTTFSELAASMGPVLPSARAAGIAFEDVAAAVATLTKGGLKTPIAVTALKGAITALASPTAVAKKQFNALGITWRGLLPTLEDIAEKNLSLDQMRNLIPDVEARTAVLTLTQNFNGLQKALGNAEASSGDMKVAFDKMNEGDPGLGFKKLWNNVGRAGTSVGKLATGPLKWATNGINSMFVSSERAGEGLDHISKKAGKLGGAMSQVATATADSFEDQQKEITEYRDLIQAGIVVLDEKTKRAQINTNTETNLLQKALGAERNALAERMKLFAEQTEVQKAELENRKAAIDKAESEGVISQAAASRQKLELDKTFTSRRAQEISAQFDYAKKIYALEHDTYKKLMLDKLNIATDVTRAEGALVAAKHPAEDGIDKLKDSMDSAKQSAEDLGETMTDQIPDKKEVAVEARVEGLNDVLTLGEAIARLKDKTVMVTTVHRSVEAKAAGGIVGSLQRLAQGGLISRGSGLRDDVPALLTRGEFVIPKSAVGKYGVDLMESLQNLSFPKAQGFADGGPVPAAGATKGMGHIHLHLGKESYKVSSDMLTLERLDAALRRETGMRRNY